MRPREPLTLHQIALGAGFRSLRHLAAVAGVSPRVVYNANAGTMPGGESVQKIQRAIAKGRPFSARMFLAAVASGAKRKSDRMREIMA